MKQYKKIARPYAKAAFSVALETNQVADWVEWLKMGSAIVSDQTFQLFLAHPRTTKDMAYQVLYQIVTDISKSDLYTNIQNFFRLLSEYQRLLMLPEITDLFQRFQAEQENIVAVDVTAAFELSKTQQEQLAKALKKRLQSDVQLSFQTNPALLGGAVIRAGDLVIEKTGLSVLAGLRHVLLADRHIS